MGMMGMFVVHPRDQANHRVDRDYCIMLSEWRIDPGTSRPVTTEMTDFNVLTMNSKVFPATDPVVASPWASGSASGSATWARWTTTRSTCTATRWS